MLTNWKTTLVEGDDQRWLAAPYTQMEVSVKMDPKCRISFT